LSTVLEQKYQSVVPLGPDSRYFIVEGLFIKGIQPQHLRSGFFKRTLRYLLGGAGGFAVDVEGATNPHRAGAGHLPPVALAAGAADDHLREWIFDRAVGGFVVLGGSPRHLCLHRLVVPHADDGLMCILRMVHGKLTPVGERLFGDVVLPECGLEEQVSCVGVVPQHLPNAGAAPGVAVAGGLALGVQLFHDGLDTHTGEVVGKDAPHDLRLLRLDDVNTILVPIAQHLPRPWLAVLEVFLDAPFLVLAGGKASCPW
jgi:hypothetical protein